MIRAALVCCLIVSSPALGPDDVNRLPSSRPTATIAYGHDIHQMGDLRLPAGKGPFPVAIVIHGGCWTSGVADRRNTAALATALTKRGIATWNIDYRALGDTGGGWPGTLQDWGAAADDLRLLARTQPLDLKRVIVVGHSAGGHAALWLAGRRHIAKTSPLAVANPLPVMAVVDLDGPGDLRPSLGYDPNLCGEAATQLMGDTAGAVPDRFNAAAPVALLPLGVPQVVVSSVFLPSDAAERYRAAAVAKGDRVQVIHATGGHFEMIAPGTADEARVEAAIVRLLGARQVRPSG
jgi:acetyl esterase/lipase